MAHRPLVVVGGEAERGAAAPIDVSKYNRAVHHPRGGAG
jgi:hypothetical protein